MRCQYAKDNGLKTVTPLCPKPSDLTDTAIGFMREYIKSEEARMIEEYKPLVIAKVFNTEGLIEKLNEVVASRFSEYVFYNDSGGCAIYDVYSELRCALDVYYNEIKHTLSNPARCIRPAFHDLAKELLISLFTVSLTLKDSYLSAYGDFETIEEAS